MTRKWIFITWLLLSILPASLAAAKVTIIHAGWLLAVPGEKFLKDRSIIIRDDRIEEIRTGFVTKDSFGENVEIIDLSTSYVLPGLIDCHTHISYETSDRDLENMMTYSDADRTVLGYVFGIKTLAAGFTTIRNVGGFGDEIFALRDAIEKGLIRGPRIQAAGAAITPIGGHEDINGLKPGVTPNRSSGACNGPVDCQRAVREMAKRGADVIKLTATGGVLSRIAAGTGQQFTDAELRAIVDMAHMLGKKVAAHAHGKAGIDAALRAGVDSIEHGTYGDSDSYKLYKKTGAYLVPTMLAGAFVAEKAKIPGFFPPSIRKKAAAVGPIMLTSFGKAYKSGVKIAFGTDAGVGAHGANAGEFALMVNSGMPPMEAIKSATVNAADLLGLGQEIGTLETGKIADIIAVTDNPLKNITVLENVSFVMARGQIYR